MRVLLVGPEREENLSLRYLSAALRSAGHDTTLARFDGLEDLPRVLAGCAHHDAFGLSMCFQARAREFLTLATALKLQAPRTPIIAGGHYATCAAHELLTHHPHLDVIVLHEGERTLVELAQVGFDSEHFAGIRGLAYRDRDGNVTRTTPRPMERDLDALPFPDRQGRVRQLAGVPTAYMFGSRGCFSSCDYCCIVALHRTAPGPRFRQRSVDNVADEMQELYHGRGIRQFVFHDDNFLVPSVRHNHERLDALAAAWRARGIEDIALVLKCRPGDLDPTVLQRLRELGLLRIFLGVESGSAAGLCSIGREQGVAESEAALELCRAHGVSAQYTLMCFHPDATVATLRTDLDFMRRHVQHPFNFCRVETYAGTALEARLRAAGRGRGDYLARTYSIIDPIVDDTCRITLRTCFERCWQTDSVMETAIGLDHLAAVARRFRPTREVRRTTQRISSWLLRVNRDLISILDDLLTLREQTSGLDDPQFRVQAREIVARERRSRLALLAEARRLRHDLEVATRGTDRERAEAGRRSPAPSQLLRRTAAATALAATLAGCGTSEYAPGPLPDTDGDGLRDECETDIFGTDPTLADSDGDGVPDGDENHDGGTLTNAEEDAQAGDICADVEDTGVSEFAPAPLQDTDGDGLPDDCEDQIFGTDPLRADSDGDGAPDGDENHDGGTMSNAEEQAQFGPDLCGDYYDDTGISEYAAAPLTHFGGEALPGRLEAEIFGSAAPRPDPTDDADSNDPDDTDLA